MSATQWNRLHFPSPFPTQEKCGPLLHALLAVVHQLVQVRLVILGSVLCAAVQGVADLHLGSLGGRAGQEVVVDRFLNEKPGKYQGSGKEEDFWNKQISGRR